MKDELNKIADRVKSLTGPDREVDLLIHAYLTRKKWRWAEFGGAFGKITDPQIAVEVKPWEGTEHEPKFYWDRPDVELVPAFTASLDAAMLLVPEGKSWTLQSSGGPGPMAFVDYCGRFRVGATPALALTAACLRALAEMQP